MNNIGSSFLLLAVALFLLWLAVTDKLSNLLDAWDVATGKTTAVSSTTTSATGNAANVATGKTTIQLSLPALPKIGATVANVGLA
jgi:hypothetical protein